MSWLITGGTGQLGKSICQVLSRQSIDFFAPTSTDLDIRNSTLSLEVIKEMQPSVVINCAAWTNVDAAESNVESAYAINTKGALNLANAAKKNGAIFAQVSTDYVFSAGAHKPWAEDAATSPLSVYGQSKADAERGILTAYPEQSYIFRTAWLYSQFGKNFAKTIARNALRGISSRVVNDQVGQPTFAADVAETIVDSITNKIPTRIYHATNRGSTTWFGFAKKIYELVGVSPEFVIPVDSSTYPQLARRPTYSVLSHDGWYGIKSEGLRDWEFALEEAIPGIISSITKGE
jgi:dTDP-4-dehydrorhamnose reductase